MWVSRTPVLYNEPWLWILHLQNEGISSATGESLGTLLVLKAYDSKRSYLELKMTCKYNPGILKILSYCQNVNHYVPW